MQALQSCNRGISNWPRQGLSQTRKAPGHNSSSNDRIAVPVIFSCGNGMAWGGELFLLSISMQQASMSRLLAHCFPRVTRGGCRLEAVSSLLVFLCLYGLWKQPEEISWMQLVANFWVITYLSQIILCLPSFYYFFIFLSKVIQIMPVPLFGLEMYWLLFLECYPVEFSDVFSLSLSFRLFLFIFYCRLRNSRCILFPLIYFA